MPIEKLRPTYTFDQDRLEQLKAVVPEAFADGKINWETLREVLGEYLEDEGPEAERFGLFWPGKRDARRLASQPSKGTLVPVPGEGVNEETTRNLFIEGENLEVLKLLQKSYAGRVKMIYIDPPYNTGNDFIYSDDYVEPLDAYLRATGQADEAGALLTSNPRASGRFHSNWLNMMYPRLLLAKALLRADGAIFVSIDDNELHNLRQIMDEIFGPENFINCIIWQKVFSPKNTARHFSEDHDYILVYARNADTWTPNLLPRSEEADARYSNPDNDPRGPWSSSDLTARNYYSEGQYEVESPSGRTFKPTIGSYWRVAKGKFEELDRDGRVWWGPDGNNMPRLKRFLSEVKQGIVPQTLWKHEDVGNTQEAKRELLKYVHFDHTENVLNSVKPPRLIERMLHIATNNGAEEDVVLDFFAGSAATAHAVLKKNAEDGGNRRFVMVQISEPLPIPEPGLTTITDIGKQRIRRVIEQMQRERTERLQLEDGNATPDLGFKVYQLDHSSFRVWADYKGDSRAEVQTLFDQFETPLVEGWKESDLLVEVMLIQGFPLDSAVARLEQFTRNTVRLVESDFHEHRLFVCLDAQIDDATIDQLQMQPEDVFVCLDSALTDQSKVRLADAGNLYVI